MKLLPNFKPLAALAAVALAGLSASVAYGDVNSPFSYVPNPWSPLFGPSFDSNSDSLDAFRTYLVKVENQLLAGKTLSKPKAQLKTEIPTDKEFYAAVQAAVTLAASGPDAAHEVPGIVSAAIQYKPAQIKNIVKAGVIGSPGDADGMVAVASRLNPLRAGDAAAGAIVGLLTVSSATAADFGDAADDAVIAETREAIERVARTALASTKPALAQAATAAAVAKAMVTEFIADAGTSNAELYFDDIARGAINGVNNFATTTKSGLATEMMNALGAAFGSSTAVTKESVTNFAMGALRGASIVPAAADPNSYASVQAALTSNAALFGATGISGLKAEIDAGAAIQFQLRSAPPPTALATFSAGLTNPGQAATIYGYVSGAVAVFKGRAADFTKLALEDVELGPLTVAQQKAIISAAVTGNFAQAGGIVTRAVNATSNAVSPVDAVTAAIPASTDLYSGAATLAAMRKITLTRPLATAPEIQAAKDVLVAAINAANAAGYSRAFGDIASSAAKAKKVIDNDLLATAIATVPSGWEEAVAAAVVVTNFRESDPFLAVTPGSNVEAAITAATAKGGATLATSVGLAISTAQKAKLSPTTIFDDAIEAAYANPTQSRAILVGAGAANAKLTAPLLGMLLRLKSGPETDAALLNYAISLNKRAKVNLEIAYSAAKDALDKPTYLFEMIDSKILTNPAQAVDIVSAAVAARPEFAHYIARAAAFRAPNAVGRTAAAAIQFAHLRSNRDISSTTSPNPAPVPVVNPDDPSAVAAIAAGVVDGLVDTKLTGTKLNNAVAAAVSGMVRASLAFKDAAHTAAEPVKLKIGLVGNNPTYLESDGTVSGSIQVHEKGTAAVVTGAVANTLTGTTAADFLHLSDLSKVVIKAAAKAARNHAYALAQAAGAAAGAVLQLKSAAFGTPLLATAFDDFDDIAQIIFDTLPATVQASITLTNLTNAARFGASQYANSGITGAGAAGILDYQQNGGVALHVSDISNF